VILSFHPNTPGRGMGPSGGEGATLARAILGGAEARDPWVRTVPNVTEPEARFSVSAPERSEAGLKPDIHSPFALTAIVVHPFFVEWSILLLRNQDRATNNRRI